MTNRKLCKELQDKMQKSFDEHFLHLSSGEQRDVGHLELDKAQARIQELEAERDKLIQAVADHVTVRAEQHQRIKQLEAQAREHIEQIRAERNCARKAEQERDALKEQVRVLSEAATAEARELYDRAYCDGAVDARAKNNCRHLPSDAIPQFRAALAAVKPAASPWQPIETAPKNVWVLVNNGGVVEIARLFQTGRWFNPSDFECACVHHWTPLPRTISPAGEGGDRG